MAKERHTPLEEVGPNSKQANIAEVKEQNANVSATVDSKQPPVNQSASHHDTVDSSKQKHDSHHHQSPQTPRAKPHLRENATFDWKSVGFWGSDPSTDKKKELAILRQIETYVHDHFIGDWYWNCSLVIGTCFFSWLIARLGFGIFSLVIVLLFTNSVYRMEYRRFNRDIRDDMRRAVANNRIDNEKETMEWLNSFLDKFWVIYMPAFSEMVLFQANAIMKDQAPGFGIEAISLDEFTLGSKAPRIDSVKSYPSKGADHIEMDWAFSFSPNDTDDMTKNQISKMIRPKVALGVTIGKAFISKSLPILVEDMSMTGRMNIKLKLTPNFPHVKLVSVQFLEAPTIDYALKPVGGDALGIDVMSFIPGLSSFVNGIIHSNLRPMLYAPNSLDIDVEEIMANQSNDSIGCIAVTIKRCTKLKTGATTKPNSINPYVQMKISNNGDIDEKTKAKKEINDPIFLETKYILINALQGNHLNLNVFDLIKDKADDKLIGTASFPLDELLQERNHSGLVKNLTESGKVVGKIEFDVNYYPTLPPIVHEDGSKEVVTDSEVGILKVTLHEAKDLDISQSVTGMLSPYAEIYVNGDLARACRQLRRTNEPSWDESFESLITNQSETTVQVLVKDAVDDKVVAQFDSNIEDIIFETSRGQQWLQASPVEGSDDIPKIRISATWKPLVFDEDVAKVSYSPPIGSIKIHLHSAKGLKNLESVGKIDPYVRVLLNGKLRGKTHTIADSVDPYFNSVFLLPVGNEHQHFLLEFMDEEVEGKDRPLGTAAVNVFEFINRDEKGNILPYDGSNEVLEQQVLLNGIEEGKLYYSVSFVPNVHALSLSQKKNMQTYLEEVEEKKQKELAQQAENERLFKENPDQYEWVEVEDNSLVTPDRVDIPLEQAIQHRAGTVTVHIKHGKFKLGDLYLQTLFDEHNEPSGVTPRAEGRSLKTHSLAEAVIRDLPNSNIIFRITKKPEVSSEREVVAEHSFKTLDMLKKSNAKPYVLRLSPGNEIEIQMEFVPSTCPWPPLDTILDIGKMRLDIVKALNLKSVDSNGKSDPLCVIKVDGIEVYKTDKKRKSLNPEWNESCELSLLSRSRQVILVEVYDWDLTHDDELLGRAQLDFSKMEVAQDTPFTAELDTQGTVSFVCNFKPEYLRPKLLGKGRFGDLSELNDIAGMGVGAISEITVGGANAVGGVVGGAGSLVGSAGGKASDKLQKGGSFFKKMTNRSRKKNNTDTDTDNETEHERVGNKDISKSGDYSNAPSQEIGMTKEEKELAEEQNDFNDQTFSSELSDAVPNLDPNMLPPPQFPGSPTSARSSRSGRHNGSSTGTVKSGPRNHQRTTSEATDMSSFVNSIHGTDAIPGRVSIVQASGFKQGLLDVKVSLQTSTKTKDLYKTRPCKPDQGVHKINESVAFRSSTEGVLHFVVREHHTFGKLNEIGRGQVQLSSVLNQTENVTVNCGVGELVVGFKYHASA
jgi:Ca2+-dependent lipid-binding protein